MSAETGRSRLPLPTILFCGMAVLVVVIGVIGLLYDSWLKRALAPRSVGAVFGLLLNSLVLIRFYWHISRHWPISSIDFRTLSRHLSRMVYLMLYAVVGLTLLLAIGSLMWTSGLAFGLYDADLLSMAERGRFEPPKDLQVYLGYALCALILIRVLAAICHRVANTAKRSPSLDNDDARLTAPYRVPGMPRRNATNGESR
jgi:cytochrome b561